MAKQYNNTLTNLISYSFPSNNLLTIQLVRSLPNSEKDSASNKVQYFFMIALAPGEKADNDFNRTYNFKRAITIKFSIHELMSLGFVMRRFAMGQSAIIGNYVKFSKSETGQKRVTVWESSKEQKTQKGSYNQRIINLGMSAAENHVINFTPEDANSFADISDQISKKAFDLEFERQKSLSSGSNQVMYENSASTNNRAPEFNNNITEQPSPISEAASQFGDMVSSLPWED